MKPDCLIISANYKLYVRPLIEQEQRDKYPNVPVCVVGGSDIVAGIVGIIEEFTAPKRVMPSILDTLRAPAPNG